MSQKVLNWRRLPTAFEKRSTFSNAGKRPAGPAPYYTSIWGSKRPPRSHSGAAKGGHVSSNNV